MSAKDYRFPKRFENLTQEELDQLAVKVVGSFGARLVEEVFTNLKEAESKLDLKKFMGPFYDLHENKMCIRFESRSACNLLSQ